VFITTNEYGPAFGGLAGGDEICQTEADNAGLAGTYRAWLSDTTGSPSSRFYLSTAPYQLVDGTVIANNWSELTDGSLAASISLLANGSSIASDSWVWTGTNTAGALARSDWHCNNWEGPDTYYGSFGLSDATDANWTQSNSISCFNSNAYSLYCFQQPDEP
jgi:hypothetical protein